MTGGYIDLATWQVGLAALLILVNAAVSLALRLGMERRLLVAAVRTVGQLALIGLVLDWVFAVGRVEIVLVLMTVMVLIAGLAAVRRTERRGNGHAATASGCRIRPLGSSTAARRRSSRSSGATPSLSAS